MPYHDNISKSDIPILNIPDGGFKSTLPPHLLHGKSESEVYILEKISSIDNFIQWAAPVLVDSNKQQRRTNGRVNSHDEHLAEQDKVLENLQFLSNGINETVNASKVALRLVRNKWFWGFLAIFFVFILPWIIAHAPTVDQVIKKIFL